MLSDLEGRIQKLEDIEAIKKLRANYCYAVDEKRLDDTLDLFSKTARIDFGPFGRYGTPAELRDFYGNLVPALIPFSMHLVHNAMIEVEGNTAIGVWYVKLPATFGPTNEPIWAAGKYDEEYVKEEGEWKFSFIRFTVYYATPYNVGWVEKPLVIDAPQ